MDGQLFEMCSLSLLGTVSPLSHPLQGGRSSLAVLPLSQVLRCGVVWCGVVGCGVVWCGVVWCGVVGCGGVWWGVVGCGVAWYGAVAKVS